MTWKCSCPVSLCSVTLTKMSAASGQAMSFARQISWGASARATRPSQASRVTAIPSSSLSSSVRRADQAKRGGSIGPWARVPLYQSAEGAATGKTPRGIRLASSG
jgi:hypothetical protein